VKPHLVWDGDCARTDVGQYALQCERHIGEPPFYTLLWYPPGADFPMDLGDGRDEYDWARCGTRHEVKALAREHYRRQLRAIAEGRPEAAS
jgi:hypothetical protein